VQKSIDFVADSAAPNEPCGRENKTSIRTSLSRAEPRGRENPEQNPARARLGAITLSTRSRSIHDAEGWAALWRGA
jgi:hypothetical protein